MARPPKPEDQLFDEDVRLRMRGQDVELLKRAAIAAGLSLSGWARERLLTIARRELKRDGGEG